MQCKCGGVLIEGKSTFRTSRINFSFILENIPAKKCMRCDEVQFSEEVKDKLHNLADWIERDSNEIVRGGCSEGRTSFRTSKKNFSLILENIPAVTSPENDEDGLSDQIRNRIQKLVNRIERDSNEIITGRPSHNLFDY